MRRKYTKYLYIAGVLLVIGNLLGSCVVFLQVNDTTHFYLVNPMSYIISQKDTLCYKKRTENTADIDGTGFFQRPTIFFHSTYCDKILDDSTACAIESAARLHPQTHINLLYTSPVELKTWNHLLSILVKLPNFHMTGIHVESYADGTEFEKFWKSVVVYNKVVDYKLVAEYIKFLTLHKFGGTVLDKDVIVNKCLDELGENWVIREGESMLGTDAIAMSRSDFNRNFTAMVLRSFSQQIMKGNINVSVAITNSFKNLCPGTDFTETYTRCHVPPLPAVWSCGGQLLRPTQVR
ncbi:unnamed protein product [Parnassius mnemosyne]|uniref:Alpha-1,4-N-acetylglucosaminyltransferase n=1 Tax=Parnassius mnemosyne TaxID=213953 RepID=A0AAV1KN79_9NEOP